MSTSVFYRKKVDIFVTHKICSYFGWMIQKDTFLTRAAFWGSRILSRGKGTQLDKNQLYFYRRLWCIVWSFMINIPGPVKSFRKIRNYGLNSTRHNMLVVLSATAIKKSNEKTRKHIKKHIKTRFPKRFLKRSIQRSRGRGYKLVLPKVLKSRDQRGDFPAIWKTNL